MSAYSIGADTIRVDTQRARTRPDRESKAPEIIVKWIPGEAITFYAAILGLGAAQGALTGNETPQELLERIEAGSFGWFITAAIVAVALVVTGALTATGPNTPGTRPSFWGIVVRVVLTLLAFLLWTTALPGSWAYSLHFVRDLGAAYAFLLIPVGFVFGAIAEALTKKVKL